MTHSTMFVIIESSGGVVQDITHLGADGVTSIAIDYDELDPHYDEFTDIEGVKYRVAELLEDLRLIPPGSERKRLRENVVYEYRQARPIGCTSTDPKDHQGDTCPVHEKE